MAEANIVDTNSDKRNADGPELLAVDSTLLLTAETGPGAGHPIRITHGNHESIIFIWYDPNEQSGHNLVGPLRAINDNVQSFIDGVSCLNAIQSSTEKVFFITTSSHQVLITKVHSLPAVEAIFILDPTVNSIRGEFPKLFGIFEQQEELLRVLREVLEIFEQIQFEIFSFEPEKVFLWSQLYREELLTRKTPMKKQFFIDGARLCYRNNPMILQFIEEFEKTYRPIEVINWCFRSPFPSRFLHHAIRSHNKEQLRICRAVMIDASRTFQNHPKRKTSEQFYRGMKFSNELLAQFEANIGRLVCTSGFFPCTKQRTVELERASLPTYRPDLIPVFLKIDCDASSLYLEGTNKNTPFVGFEICTAFRIVYVNRQQMTVIKLKVATDSGKKIALNYMEEHKGMTIQSLLDLLMKPPTPPPPPPKPPTPPPPPKPATPPPPPPKPATKPKSKPKPKPVPAASTTKDTGLTPEELKAKRCAERGEIEKALAAYRRIEPTTPRILNAMGQLAATRKGDFDYAIKCHTRALKMQEEAGEDCSETLTDLGNVYHQTGKFDMALNCHTRASTMRQAKETPDEASIGANHVGIANAHWARQEYSEAIDNAQRALTIRESLIPRNEASIAATLGMLGNMYQDSGNDALGIELSKKALAILERTLASDSPILAELYFNMGMMQASMELYSDASHSLERAVKVYRKILPEGHPDLVAAQDEHRRISQLAPTNNNVT